LHAVATNYIKSISNLSIRERGEREKRGKRGGQEERERASKRETVHVYSKDTGLA
jgi:hypothetical protein